MWSLEVIKEINRKHRKAHPVEYKGNVDFKIPHIDPEYTSKTWKHKESLFVDKTGIDDSGRSMRYADFIKYIEDAGLNHAYGMSEEGQFQVHVEVFTKQ